MKRYIFASCLFLLLFLDFTSCHVDHFKCEPESLVFSSDAQDGNFVFSGGILCNIYSEEGMTIKHGNCIEVESSWYSLFHNHDNNLITVSVKENTSKEPRQRVINLIYTNEVYRCSGSCLVTIIQRGREE